MSYATQAQFEDYAVGWNTDDPATLAKHLRDATFDVDSVLPRVDLESDGTKYGDLAGGSNPKGLTAAQLVCVRRAVCAQVEYRSRMGPEFFATDQHENVSGSDFSKTGKLGFVAPAAIRELDRVGLVGKPAGRRWGSLTMTTVTSKPLEAEEPSSGIPTTP
jgi:hypothetical protein